MMRLYYCDVLAPRKACALARHLQAPVEYVYVNLGALEQKSPRYVAINPNGQVPSLTDGSRVLWEADAILCYLAEQAGSDLWPRDSRQIEIVRWFSWAAQNITRSGGALYFEHIIKARFGIGPPDPAAVQDALAAFRKAAAVLERHLEGREWLVGEAPTVAEFSVGVTLPYAGGANLPIDEFPNLKRWHDQLNAFPAWRDPFPATPCKTFATLN